MARLPPSKLQCLEAPRSISRVHPSLSKLIRKHFVVPGYAFRAWRRCGAFQGSILHQNSNAWRRSRRISRVHASIWKPIRKTLCGAMVGLGKAASITAPRIGSVREHVKSLSVSFAPGHCKGPSVSFETHEKTLCGARAGLGNNLRCEGRPG